MDPLASSQHVSGAGSMPGRHRPGDAVDWLVESDKGPMPAVQLLQLRRRWTADEIVTSHRVGREDQGGVGVVRGACASGAARAGAATTVPSSNARSSSFKKSLNTLRNLVERARSLIRSR